MEQLWERWRFPVPPLSSWPRDLEGAGKLVAGEAGEYVCALPVGHLCARLLQPCLQQVPVLCGGGVGAFLFLTSWVVSRDAAYLCLRR